MSSRSSGAGSGLDGPRCARALREAGPGARGRRARGAGRGGATVSASTSSQGATAPDTIAVRRLDGPSARLLVSTSVEPLGSDPSSVNVADPLGPDPRRGPDGRRASPASRAARGTSCRRVVDDGRDADVAQLALQPVGVAQRRDLDDTVPSSWRSTAYAGSARSPLDRPTATAMASAPATAAAPARRRARHGRGVATGGGATAGAGRSATTCRSSASRRSSKVSGVMRPPQGRRRTMRRRRLGRAARRGPGAGARGR